MALLSDAELAELQALSESAMPDRVRVLRQVTAPTGPNTVPNAARSPRASTRSWQPVAGLEEVPARVFRPQVGQGPDGSGAGSLSSTSNPRVAVPLGTPLLVGDRLELTDDDGQRYVLQLSAPVAPASYSVHLEFEADTVQVDHQPPA